MLLSSLLYLHVTGSNWITNILHFLMATGPLEKVTSTNLCNVDMKTSEEINAYPSPRFMHTHFKPNMLSVGTFTEERKVVLVFRNPKDTAVSLFHFLQVERITSDGLKLSWNAFINHWMTKSCMIFVILICYIIIIAHIVPFISYEKSRSIRRYCINIKMLKNSTLLFTITSMLKYVWRQRLDD